MNKKATKYTKLNNAFKAQMKKKKSLCKNNRLAEWNFLAKSNKIGLTGY